MSASGGCDVVSTERIPTDVFRSMLPDEWKNLTNIEREKVLQTIVNVHCEMLGITQIPRVWMDKFPDDSSRLAEYYPMANQITIRENLCDGDRISINGVDCVYEFYLQHVYFSLMHEMRHAIQRYYVMNPELCDNEGWLELMKNNQSAGSPETSAYFTIDNKLDTYWELNAAHLLYSLQPSEVDANAFAQKQLTYFVQEMHDLYPDCWMYQKVDIDTAYEFNENFEEARIAFLTDSPVEDINDVLFLINDDAVVRRINDCICKAVRDTQDQRLYEKLETQLDLRQKMIEEQIKLQDAKKDEIDYSIFLDL